MPKATDADRIKALEATIQTLERQVRDLGENVIGVRWYPGTKKWHAWSESKGEGRPYAS